MKNWNGIKSLQDKIRRQHKKERLKRSLVRTVRSRAARVREALSDRKWKIIHGYRMRWRVRSLISDYKRMFREAILSKTFNNIIRRYANL